MTTKTMTNLTDLFTHDDCLQAGNLFFSGKQYEKAVSMYLRAIEIQPNSTNAAANLSTVNREMGNLNLALEYANLALKFDPNNALAYSARSSARLAQGNLRDAEFDLWAAVGLQKDHPAFWAQMGHLQTVAGNMPVALTAYKRSVALNPMDFGCQLSVALAKMSSGDWGSGALNEYEVRHLVGGNPCPQNGRPIWNGEPLDGKTILICAEQGLGDMVQFLRYARLLKERGSTVYVLCRPGWVKLARRARGVCQVFSKPEETASYDYHVPALSLLRLMGVYDGDVPYLDFLAPTDFPYETPTVGFCCAGNPRHPYDRYRSIPRELFKPLEEFPGITPLWLGEENPALDTPERLADAINGCDLVVTVDTAAAHIAGALGRPVWTLLPVGADWRWAKGQNSTPWYPTMELFRCENPLEWGLVIERVRKKMVEWRREWR